jgi:hypothetical protein
MTKTVLISGDVVVDHHLYEGRRYTASASDLPGIAAVREHGGAMLLHNLIKTLVEAGKAASVEGQQKREQALTDARNSLEKIKNDPASGNIEDAKQMVINAEKNLSDEKLTAAFPEREWDVKFGLTTPSLDALPCGHHAMAVWKPFPMGKKNYWRADLLMGYGRDPDNDNEAKAESTDNQNDDKKSLPDRDESPKCNGFTPKVLTPPPDPNILILDDAGFIFRRKALEHCWFLPANNGRKPDWIVLKMSGTVCQGDLWSRLKNDFNDRLVVVISAQELRQECVRMSTGLSWERTIEELRDALQSEPLKSLSEIPRHLIVTFSSDGALWLNNTGDKPAATMVYDASGGEAISKRQFSGKAFGYMSCMVASIARELIRTPEKPDLERGIRAGLLAMRDLRQYGHGEASPQKQPAGFPIERLSQTILLGGGGFSTTPVPWTEEELKPFAPNPEMQAEKQPWRIVEMSQCPFGSNRKPSLLGLATQVVIYGKAALQGLPHAQFGDLFTADRFEIETLRTIERLMCEYRDEKKVKKPLSIGVFGPPGAGKSFGVRQISNEIFGTKAWLEFNLSQFKDVTDLIGAFHQVRDIVLSGITPVAFWDEFDSRKYEWLQYLLAPMQDGRFQEGQLNHAIGKCVFIFAGATGYSFNEFGPAKPGDKSHDEESWKDFRLKKGPDFHSRLDVYYDVLGPNQRTVWKYDKEERTRVRDQKDVCTPLRRAILVRALLKVPENMTLDFDPDLIHALLETPEYAHGARSMEKIITALKPERPEEPIRRSSLLPSGQLAMHIKEPRAFMDMLGRHTSFMDAEVIEAIAEGIHETWWELSKKEGWKMQPNYDKPYKELGEVEKEENRAAARRIPDILALAGLKIQKGIKTDETEAAKIQKHIEYHLRRLAEAEHEGWMAHRKKNGWRHHPQRDDTKKLHHALVAYEELNESDQKKDQSSVQKFQEMLKRAEYQIVWA